LTLFGPQVWPTPTGREKRVYRLGRRRVELIDAKRRVAYVGAELQDKYARYGWNLRVRDLVATGLHRTDLLLLPVTSPQARRVGAALRLCGLHRHAPREFLSLSYGQKRLALMARALVQDPDWLLLDEFYNGLDADYRRRLDTVLDAAVRRGQSWVATAHRAGDVPRGTQRILELAQGRVHAVKRIRPSDLARLAVRAGESPRHRGKLPRAGKLLDVGKPPRAPNASSSSAPWLLKLSQVDLYVDY